MARTNKPGTQAPTDGIKVTERSLDSYAFDPANANKGKPRGQKMIEERDSSIPCHEDRAGQEIMHSRMSSRVFDFAPMHSKTAIWILRFTVTLLHLADANQRFHADPEKLEEWADVRANLGQCKEPIMYFGSDHVHQEGELLEHRELMWAVDAVITELKLRNLGCGQRDIMLDEVHHIRGLVVQLDRCRKRVMFY